MTRKHEVLDDHGNALPPPEAGTDVANIIYLLEYGRTRDFRIGPIVKVGETTVQVLDLRQASQAERAAAPAELDPASDMGIILSGGGT